ncbi:MAG TPA: type II secretion system protein, partial [Gemmatimonadaceae bacterium]
MRIHPDGGRGGRRPGMTLVELLISMLLLSFVMGTILTVVMRQQRFYRSASEIMETRGQLRSAISILPVELRGVSTQVRNATGAVIDSDIRAMGPTSIEVRSTFGGGVVCDIDGSTVTLYPDELASNGLRIGGFLYEPGVGDIVYFLNNGEGGSADDSWEQRVIGAAPTTNAKCTAGIAGATAADLALPRREITLSAAPSADIAVGAPVRVSRTVEYALYQDG